MCKWTVNRCMNEHMNKQMHKLLDETKINSENTNIVNVLSLFRPEENVTHAGITATQYKTRALTQYLMNKNKTHVQSRSRAIYIGPESKHVSVDMLWFIILQ